MLSNPKGPCKCPTFVLGADCLKDLQRFLREDDPRTRDAFFTVGQYKTARSDLVPLITTYAADTDIVYNACATFSPQPQLHLPIAARACLCKPTKHYSISAVKVVTFLTMPVEEDSEKHSLQVRRSTS